MILHIHTPDDDLVEDPFGKVYARLQKEWMIATAEVFEGVGRYEADGATMDSLADMVDVLWERAQVAREQWEKFSRKYHEYIEVGPGPRNTLCIRCLERPRRVADFSELCQECVLIVIESTVK